MNEQLKSQLFNLCFPMRSPIAVPRLGLQDLIVPGVSGPAEGQSFWKSFFILTLRLCMGVHFLFVFSGMGNALYLRRKKKLSLFVCSALYACSIMLLPTGRCWSSSPGDGVHLDCFSEVMS